MLLLAKASAVTCTVYKQAPYMKKKVGGIVYYGNLLDNFFKKCSFSKKPFTLKIIKFPNHKRNCSPQRANMAHIILYNFDKVPRT